MSRDIVEKIKKIKNYNGQVNPDRDWVAQNRAQMMTQIKNTLPETKPKFNFDMVWQGIGIFIPNRIVYHVVRPVTVFVLVAAIGTSSWIASVSATENCLPGDICYGMKLAAERTQVAVVSVISSDEREAQMHMELASKRAKEIKQLSDNNITSESTQLAVASMEESIHAAEEKMKTVGQTNPAKVLEVSKNVTEKTKEIKETLKDLGSQIDVENVQKLTNEVSLASVELVVQKKEEGTVQVSDEEVKQLVTDQINIVSNDVGIVQLKAGEVTQQVNNNSTTNTSVVINTSSTSPATTSSSSTVVTTTTINISEVLENTNQVVAVNAEQTEKNLTEAKTLLESNQILEAIQKVKEVSQTTQETAKVVNEAQKIVNDVQVQSDINKVDVGPVLNSVSDNTTEKITS